MPADQFIGSQIPNGLKEAGDGKEAKVLILRYMGYGEYMVLI